MEPSGNKYQENSIGARIEPCGSTIGKDVLLRKYDFQCVQKISVG